MARHGIWVSRLVDEGQGRDALGAVPPNRRRGRRLQLELRIGDGGRRDHLYRYSRERAGSVVARVARVARMARCSRQTPLRMRSPTSGLGTYPVLRDRQALLERVEAVPGLATLHAPTDILKEDSERLLLLLTPRDGRVPRVVPGMDLRLGLADPPTLRAAVR